MAESIAPEQLVAGDRPAFEANQRQAASGLLFAGIASMVLAPIVLVLGLLAALLRRRQMPTIETGKEKHDPIGV